MSDKPMAERKLRIYTTQWCPDCWRAKQFLSRYHLSFEEVNIEKTPEATAFVIAANQGKQRVPTFEMEGRTFHCSPFDPEILRRELDLRQV